MKCAVWGTLTAHYMLHFDNLESQVLCKQKIAKPVKLLRSSRTLVPSSVAPYTILQL